MYIAHTTSIISSMINSKGEYGIYVPYLTILTIVHILIDYSQSIKLTDLFKGLEVDFIFVRELIHSACLTQLRYKERQCLVVNTCRVTI